MKTTRLLAAILALVFVLSIAASCGSSRPSSPGAGAPVASGGGTDMMNATGYPIAKSPITVTALILRGPEDGRWENLIVNQWYEEISNVKFEYEYVNTNDEYKTQVNLKFASGSYPDVLLPLGDGTALSWQDEEAFGREGFLIDIKPYLDKYMPNAQHFFSLYPQLKAGQTAGNGCMYGFPFYFEDGYGGNIHIGYMETYWADKIGYADDMPYSVEEFKEFMYKIKAVMDSGDYFRPEPDMFTLGYQSKYGTCTYANLILSGYVGSQTAVDVGDGPFGTRNNKDVEFFAEHPGYRKTLEMFRDFYRDGIIDPDVFTMERPTWQARKTACKYACYTDSSSSLKVDLIRSNPDVNPDYAGVDTSKGFGCRTFRPLTSEYNDKARIGFVGGGIINTMLLTDKCKYPEIMARWADMFFQLDFDETDNSVPNPIMFTMGFYGEHWEYTNLQRNQWTFLQRMDGEPGDAGDGKIDWTYFGTYIASGWLLPCGGYIDDNFVDGSPMYVAKQYTNKDYQFPYSTNDNRWPDLARMTEDEVVRAAAKSVDLREYLYTSWATFMSGQKELNDANWDDFLTTCKQLGSDEITEIKQAVYDRWNEAMK